MNSYDILNARLVADPETRNAGGTELTELRLADNPIKQVDKKGNKIKARFVTAKFWGFLAASAAKLSKGDVIAVSGELGIESWTKDGVEHDKDVMRVTNFAVSKSTSFYEKSETPSEAPDMTPGKDALPF